MHLMFLQDLPNTQTHIQTNKNINQARRIIYGGHDVSGGRLGRNRTLAMERAGLVGGWARERAWWGAGPKPHLGAGGKTCKHKWPHSNTMRCMNFKG